MTPTLLKLRQCRSSKRCSRSGRRRDIRVMETSESGQVSLQPGLVQQLQKAERIATGSYDVHTANMLTEDTQMEGVKLLDGFLRFRCRLIMIYNQCKQQRTKNQSHTDRSHLFRIRSSAQHRPWHHSSSCCCCTVLQLGKFLVCMQLSSIKFLLICMTHKIEIVYDGNRTLTTQTSAPSQRP